MSSPLMCNRTYSRHSRELDEFVRITGEPFRVIARQTDANGAVFVMVDMGGYHILLPDKVLISAEDVVPEQPVAGAITLDRKHWSWQRIDGHWTSPRAGRVLKWSELWQEYGPLQLLWEPEAGQVTDREPSK